MGQLRLQEQAHLNHSLPAAKPWWGALLTYPAEGCSEVQGQRLSTARQGTSVGEPDKRRMKESKMSPGLESSQVQLRATGVGLGRCGGVLARLQFKDDS